MLNLRPGAKLRLEIEADARGHVLTISKVVGSQAKVVSTKRVESEEQALLAVARWADGKVAQCGLEKVR